jgi:next to BRCA1 gene 1 protein
MVPKPASVEDEPETAQQASAQPDLIKFDEPIITPAASAAPAQAAPQETVTPSLRPSMDRLGNSIADAEARHKLMERKMKLLAASVAKLNIDQPQNQAGSSHTQQSAAATPKPMPMLSPPAYEAVAALARPNFTVCCNSCDKTIPDSHFHCATCDDGDFDLCQDCVDKGITCFGAGHWLIKRTVNNGVIVSSTTEKIAPKKPRAPMVAGLAGSRQMTPAAVSQAKAALDTALGQDLIKKRIAARLAIERELKEKMRAATVPAPVQPPIFSNYAFNSIRTCNCCVQGEHIDTMIFCRQFLLTHLAELPEHDFVHCTTCEDFDLCKSCFAKDRHGHHPKHAFIIVAPDSQVTEDVVRRLAAGRNEKHNAICDGCDKYIVGVRHKCLDCPDWDYCDDCVTNAHFIHPDHRFVPIYEPVDIRERTPRPVHLGISCDGPLCNRGARYGHQYIVGDRYKCAVCHDTDFCANCEASPANTHNKTHPLIKFKSPVRHVSVTTTGERENGAAMPTMGDHGSHQPTPNTPRRRAAPAVATQPIAATNVQTVVDVKPSEPEIKAEEKSMKEEAVESPKAATPVAEELSAVYVKDTVADGTVMPPDHVFEQTWVLRNAGTTSWPAGCAVKFAGGDYMGHVDPKHPVAVQKLVPAFESTVCYAPLAPGQSYAFTVLLRTPAKEGRSTSYWRLTTKDGLKFGHRLWCDVEVRQAAPAAEEKVEEKQIEIAAAEEVQSEKASIKSEGSQMIFPKLDKESPIASIHEVAKSEPASVPPAVADVNIEHEVDDFEGVDEDGEWDDSDDGVLTDEEYDILDASDEEAIEEEEAKLLKK